ncbi:MAG: hypothetical protein ACE5EZ_05730 [Thermodesulfobacteriota bacterium]
MLLSTLLLLSGICPEAPGNGEAMRPERTISAGHNTCLKGRNLLALLIFLTLLTAIIPAPRPAGAAEAVWEPQTRAWLLALTYPDEDPLDFGKEILEGDKALLKEFQPEVFIAPEGLMPVDFYKFYLPKTTLKDENGHIIKTGPKKPFLKRAMRKAGYYLDYEGPENPCEGTGCQDYVTVGYGRVYRERARFHTKSGIREMPLLILKYNFAFTYSGIPAEVGPLKELLLGLFIDPERFHELDIHGAIHVILNEKKRPIVLLLAQHNHFRTYVFGKDIPAAPWEESSVKICFALRSNEPYPCTSDARPARRRTVGNPVNISYVIDGADPPFLSGRDIVFSPKAGARPVIYNLKFLSRRDPLYVSWIPLGAVEKILFFKSFYRKGPPGMDLNTWPELKKYSDIMQFWYFRDGSTEDAALMKGAFRGFTDVDFKSVLESNGERLYNDIVDAKQRP